MDWRTADKCTNLVESPFLLDSSLKIFDIPGVEETYTGKENCSTDVFPSLTCCLENPVSSEISSTEEDVCPATPSPDRDGSRNSSISDEDLDGSFIGCQTPKKGIFDPFAPAAERLACAPKKKDLTGRLVPLRRRLKFDSAKDIPEMLPDDDDDAFKCVSEDDPLLEYLCQLFFDLIVSNHLDEISSELSSHPQDSGSPRTFGFTIRRDGDLPPSTPKNKCQIEDICRKLEFEASVG